MPFKGHPLKKESSKVKFLPVPTVETFEKDYVSSQDDDTLCGVGSFKPQWLQKLNNSKVLLAHQSLLGVFRGAFFTYVIGCVSTLEKRYAYDSKMTGILLISDEFGPMFFGLLLGYFGGKSHRPRIMAAGMTTVFFGALFMCLPYFIYGPMQYKAENLMLNKSKEEFCDMNVDRETCEKNPTVTAVVLLCIGNFLKGLGSLPFYTIGSSYLDDSVKKKDSPFYFGTLYSFGLLGPVFGFLLSSLCLQFYEDPFHDPGFGPEDPRWIGAWWLGFIVLGICILVFSIPMILFPRYLPGTSVPESIQKQKNPKSPLQELKEMGIAIKRLGKNPILVCHYIGATLRINGLVGYFLLLPKYMEMQFRQSASQASLYSGPSCLVAMQIGIFLSGIVIRKYRPRPRVMTAGIVIAESFNLFALISCMLITCPLYPMAGTTSATSLQLNLDNSCNANCMCTTKAYTPICGPDGKSTYFSPCYAGCTGHNKSGANEIFTDCDCFRDTEGTRFTGIATKGYCGPECQWMITYVVLLSLGKLFASTASVPMALVTLRCVDPGDKSLALGSLSGFFSLLGFIPPPLIFGALTDSTCLVWEQSCGKTGNCWVYDIDQLRFLLHGVAIGFVLLGTIADISIWVLSPRIKNLYDAEEEKAEEQSGHAVNGSVGEGGDGFDAVEKAGGSVVVVETVY